MRREGRGIRFRLRVLRVRTVRTVRTGHGYLRPGSYVNLVVSLGPGVCARADRSGRSAAWLARLVRDQEVDGSNPFAPTNSFRTSNLQHTKKSKTSWLWARHSFFKSPARNQSFSSEFSVLRCEVHHTASPGLGKLSTRSRFWKKNQTLPLNS